MGSLVFENIRSLWRRRTYRRLEGLPLGSKKNHMRVVKLGGGGSNNRSRRSWKVRRQFIKLSVKATLSPVRILTRLRDSYMDIMLLLAGGEARPSALLSKGTSINRDEAWGRRMPKSRQMSNKCGDFEQRMMLHIYRSIVAAPEVIAY